MNALAIIDFLKSIEYAQAGDYDRAWIEVSSAMSLYPNDLNFMALKLALIKKRGEIETLNAAIRDLRSIEAPMPVYMRIVVELLETGKSAEMENRAIDLAPKQRLFIKWLQDFVEPSPLLDEARETGPPVPRSVIRRTGAAHTLAARNLLRAEGGADDIALVTLPTLPIYTILDVVRSDNEGKRVCNQSSFQR